MRNELTRILTEYREAKNHRFEGHPLAGFIRTETTEAVKKALGPDGSNLIFKGSAGRSKWADSPWIAILDPVVTHTPERGYYVVYLFSRTMAKVVLSLQLGTTAIRKEFGDANGRLELQRSTELIRRRIGEFKDFFSGASIDLAATSDISRASFYQAAHAFGKEYSSQLPENDLLIQDLRNIINLYRLLTFRGGLSHSGELDVLSEAEDLDSTGTEDPRRYILHRRIERNPVLAEKAKRFLGFICQACGLDFENKYGVIGKQYIEAHHLTPLSELKEKGPITLDVKKDFAVLCSNCHRMIHRMGPSRSVNGLRSLIEVQQKRMT